MYVFVEPVPDRLRSSGGVEAFIIAKRPDAKKLIDQLTPVQGWVGRGGVLPGLVERRPDAVAPRAGGGAGDFELAPRPEYVSPPCLILPEPWPACSPSAYRAPVYPPT